MSLAEARIVRQQFLKSFSTTDTRLVPASGVTVIVHRQGATIAGGVTMLPTQPRLVSVRSLGQIAVDDIVYPAADTNRPLVVVSLDPATRKIELLNNGSSAFAIAKGERLFTLDSRVTISKDAGLAEAFTPTGSITTDSSGVIEFYSSEPRVDLRYSGGGITAGARVDVDAGLMLSQPLPWLNASDYGSLQQAVDALPANIGGLIVIPAGEYVLTAPLVLPKDKAVHLLGAGVGRTILSCANPAVDLVRVKGSHCTLERMTLRGPGSVAASETEGRGVVVGTLATDSASSALNHFKMVDVRIEATAGWALYFIGHIDSGAELGKSLSIWNTIQSCEFLENRTFGLVRVGHSCTTTTFRDCVFGGARGYSAHVQNGDNINFDACTFEGSDDTKPYVELARTLSTRFAACRFEHHGGLNAPHSSNTQRFLVIGSGCRTITVDSCRFTRNSSDASVVPVAVPNVARIGDVPAGAGAADPALAIVFMNVDFQVPNNSTSQADDDVVVDHQSEVLVVGGRSGFNAASIATAFKPIRVQATLGASEKQGSRAVTILNQPFQMRLPVMPASARDAVTAWTSGDLTVDETTGRLLMRSSASSWREVPFDSQTRSAVTTDAERASGSWPAGTLTLDAATGRLFVRSSANTWVALALLSDVS